MTRKILLFSTLSPWPFWAGSETYWFDLVKDERVRGEFEFHVRLAESPRTREKAGELEAAGAKVGFYRHYNVDFVRRNVGRLRDRLSGSCVRRLPWYDAILNQKWDLIWFAVDGLHNLRELEYAVGLCKRVGVPYWLQLQHGYEDFFLTNEPELELYADISTSAKRFVFIAERNRRSLERAIGRRLDNAFHSQNGLPASKLEEAGKLAENSPPGGSGAARFFNLGRFSPKDKGQHLLLEVLAQSVWVDRDWQLSFIGVNGFGEQYLRRLSDHLELAPDRIEIVPFTSDVFGEIARCDVLLMPSLAEGTPYAMIESMACGRPAVGTPVGGIPELVVEGETGWLARTVAVEDIGYAMERMWHAREQWASIGDAARTHVVANNSETVIYSALIDQLRADASR